MNNHIIPAKTRLGFRWYMFLFSMLIAGSVSFFGFIFGSVMTAHTTSGMNQTYALIMEANVPPPQNLEGLPQAQLHRWQQNATLLSFTADGAEHFAMVSTQPANMEGQQMRIWYNATTFGNVMLDSERPFRVPRNMLPIGVICLSIAIVMLWHANRLKQGYVRPVKRHGLGGGRHKGRK